MNERIKDRQAVLTIASLLIAAIFFFARLEAHVRHLEAIEIRIEQKVDDNSHDVNMVAKDLAKAREDLAQLKGFLKYMEKSNSSLVDRDLDLYNTSR